jgi:hypothetical protein
MNRYLLPAALAIVCSSANATNFYNPTHALVTKVESVNANVNSYFPGNPLGDYFNVAGFTSAGACKVDPNSGLIVLEVSNDVSGRRQFNTALTALVTGKTVDVAVNDSLRDANGYCIVVAIVIGP